MGMKPQHVRLRRDFKNRLQQAMDKKGWSLEETRKRAGIGQASMSAYLRPPKGESYTALPRGDALYDLARALGVNESWLFGANVTPDGRPASAPELVHQGALTAISQMEDRLAEVRREWRDGKQRPPLPERSDATPPRPASVEDVEAHEVKRKRLPKKKRRA